MEPGSLLAPRARCFARCVGCLGWKRWARCPKRGVPCLWPERVLLYFFPVCRFYSDNM